MRRRDPEERFLSHVQIDPGTGCWNWTGYRMKNGYGTFGIGYKAEGTNRKVFAHRWAFENWREPIPTGMVVDHLCRNVGCCNPEHLEAVTQRENLMRGATVTKRNAEATHCIRGHEFIGDNVRIMPQGWRRCRVCHRENMRRLYREGHPDAQHQPDRIKTPDRSPR